MDVFVPHTLEEALADRAAHPDAVPVAGGTDLMVDVNFGRARPPRLLDLSRVEELACWRQTDGVVHLGAGMTFARIARELPGYRALAESARSVGSPQIRNRATVGGNLATASPAGDALPVLAAYGADVVLARSGGTRKVPIGDFLVGPKRTALDPDELIVAVEWPEPHGPGSFAKVGPRNAMVIAVAGVCLQLDCRARRVRVALGSVAPTVIRARAAEAFAEEVLPWHEPALRLPPEAAAELGRLAAGETRPIDDVRGSAAYRRHVVEVLVRRLSTWALDDRREGRW